MRLFAALLLALFLLILGQYTSKADDTAVTTVVVSPASTGSETATVLVASPNPEPVAVTLDPQTSNTTSSVEVTPSPQPSSEPTPTPGPVPAPVDTTVSTTLDTPIETQTAAVETPLATSSPAPVVVETVTPGGDDSSYRIPITVPVLFNGIEYTNIYATTNSVIAFGQEDGTYWDYPNTPSISIESKDWWVLPQQMPDTHFIIRTSDGGFQVDGIYRPYGTMTGDTTQIVITAQILTDGTVSYTYSVDGPLAGNERTGARLQNGTVVTLEQAGVTQVEAPVVLAPETISQEELAAQQAAAEAARIAAAAEAARLEAARLAAIEAARIAAEAETARLAAIEAARLEAIRLAAEEAARVEAARVAAEAAAAEAARVEAARLEAERIAREAAEAAARIPQVPAGASTVSEGGSIDFVAPEGKRIASINAWYGDPADGSRGIDVSAQLTQEFAGRTSATIQSSNQYGDPAGGTVKILIVLVTYEDVPAPAPAPQPAPQPEPTPVEPTPAPEPAPQQIPEPEPAPQPAPEPSPEPTPEPEPPVAIPDPEPLPTEPPIEEPSEPTEPQPEPVEPEAPPVEPEAPPVEPEQPVEPAPEPESPQPEPENPIEEPLQPPVEEPAPEPTTPAEEVTAAVDDAKADGKVTEAEKEIIAEALVATLAPGESLTKEQIQEAGIEYKDLPPATPVEVRQDENGNEVIITADVAAALVLLENPAELIGELFNDPGQALQALGSIGADMSPQEREEAEKMVVAAVIAGGAALNAVGAAAAGGTTSGGSTGGGSGGGGGGGASGESGYRRRKP